jgi:thiosulfate reductase cytochrome b subunit
MDKLAKDITIIHPLWLRLMHWLNAVAVIVLIMSGLRIYNATGFLGFRFPNEITLGGWLGGALLWHFAAMWLLVFNGILYLAINIISGRFTAKFLPVSIKGIWDDVVAFLTGKLNHSDLGHYNMIQRFLYLFVFIDLIVIVCSGLVLWKSVQFPNLRTLMGGYEGARLVHFAGMATLVGFLAVHVVLSLMVPKVLKTMITGK